MVRRYLTIKVASRFGSPSRPKCRIPAKRCPLRPFPSHCLNPFVDDGSDSDRSIVDMR
jgi:hypothetical protein